MKTIDERLEALTERHESLTMSMELFHAQFNSDISNLRKLIETDAENIRSLARIAEVHEHRLDRIEQA